MSTEQAFAADLRTNEIAKTVDDSNVSENVQSKTAVETEETATDVAKTADVVELTTETADEAAVEVAVDGPVVETESENVIQGRSFSGTEAEGTTVVYEETATTEATLEEVTEKVEATWDVKSSVSAVEEKADAVLQVPEREGKSVEAVKESEGVKNIADALIELEKEIKSQQVMLSTDF